MNTQQQTLKTNKQWYPYSLDGSYYKLEDGVLMQCPMNRDGTRDESECEVDWDRGVSDYDRPHLKMIVKQLEEKE